MRNSSQPAGAYLRSLRKSRRLTLLQVEQLTHLSTAVLSRLERGERGITRTDCLVLSKGYALTPYESYTLFSMAGFMPEAQRVGSEAEVRALAIGLLKGLPFPAVLMDTLGNLHAWNASLDAIWKPPHDRPVHVLDDLFSEGARRRLGANWRTFASRAVWLFAQRSLAMANEPAYRETFRHLESKHGREIIDLMEAADGAASPGALEMAQMGLLFEHDSPEGVIRYVNSQVLLHTNSAYELHMHLPVDGENLRRFHAMFDGVVTNVVIEAWRPVAPQP
ncbi:MAG: helix-turn-helix domain-containing protein [Caldilineaceae bacterium]